MSASPKTRSVGIAGAGLMGRLLAWQLTRQGHTVTLFDKDPIESGEAASYTAAGMLTPYAELESAETLIHSLGMHSLTLWPSIIDALPEGIRYTAKGSLIVAHEQDRQELQQFTRHIHARIQPSSTQFQTLNHSQIHALEPQLAQQFQSAYYLPEEAWVSAEDVMRTFGEVLPKLGIHWHAQEKVLSADAGSIKTAKREYSFDWVVDCRGLGGKNQWPDLRGVRGELICVQAPEVYIQRLVRLMHPRYRLYLAPLAQDSMYIVGATQIESDDRSPISVRSCLELLSAVYSLHPSFAEARIISTKTNCRPALRNNLPQVSIRPGLMRINGLFRHGYLLAPAISQRVTQWFSTLSVLDKPIKNLLETTPKSPLQQEKHPA